ncbi:hypothetical protein L1987_13538 [Smallanthus sonchifolius]|uniref:Uncharacterized protein n=1 Tax=Smallanthus sonchifolius TaxID=185202 RepID=A0ACB9JHC0_9ASTR|nr:hypothetical protein L1987_13538 [Smallanthus sonchifolius]
MLYRISTVQLLPTENDRLQKQVSQLVCENGYMRQPMHKGSAATDASCDSVSTTPQHSLREDDVFFNFVFRLQVHLAVGVLPLPSRLHRTNSFRGFGSNILGV